MRKLTSLLTAVAVSHGALVAAHTQKTDPNQLEQAPFASENAIIDTSIPFAIGAREAQQSLRGAFGWPTFQEGLVQGVYFRFDPDGYARFAPTPRLDTDVFEVICRPRTYSCMGRKGALSVILNSRGQIQLKIDDILSGDRFFVSEGVSEIEIPERILQPLDTQLELLLSTGGDLIVRRGDNEKDRISLTGLLPVTAYLRWVTARQDYTILPRGWPVPNAAGSNGAVTQATTWQSPMPQPQNFPSGQNGQTQGEYQPTTQPLQVQVQPTIISNNQSEVDEVKSELKVLRELLMKRNLGETQPATAQVTQSEETPQSAISGSISQLMPQSVSPEPVSDQIAALQQASAQIQADLQRLTQPQIQPRNDLSNVGLVSQVSVPEQEQSRQIQSNVPSMIDDPTMETAKRLQYLMSEIGLDAKTALMLLQMGEEKTTSTAVASPEPSVSTVVTSQPKYQDNVVAQILQELESDVMNQKPKSLNATEDQQEMTNEDFVLLSNYFKSVVLSR